MLLGHQKQGFRNPAPHTPTNKPHAWPKGSYLTSLSLSFLIWKMNTQKIYPTAFWCDFTENV